MKNIDIFVHERYNKADYEHIAIVNYSGITDSDIARTAQLLIDVCI